MGRGRNRNAERGEGGGGFGDGGRAARGLVGKRLFVLDMDGTIYLGDRLFPWTKAFLDAVRVRGGSYLFLTNNSSRTAKTYVDKLRRLGVEAMPGDVLTSGDATIELLRAEGRFRRLFLLATPEVEGDFRSAGFDLAHEDPDAVVLTFDMTLDYGKLRRMCALLRAGLPYVASHPDINCPAPEGPIPDIGAFMALVEASTGRRPGMVVGKPSPEFLRAAMLRKGASPEQTVVIGDRLYTDIACANAAGVTSILVLSGESTREMAAASPHRPDYIFDTLADVIPCL